MNFESSNTRSIPSGLFGLIAGIVCAGCSLPSSSPVVATILASKAVPATVSMAGNVSGAVFQKPEIVAYDGVSQSFDFSQRSTTLKEFTVALMVKSTASSGIILSLRGQNTGSAVDLAIGSDGSGNHQPGKLMALVRPDHSRHLGFSEVAGSAINDGAFHYVVLTRSAGTLKLYVDGVLSNCIQNTGTDPITADLNRIASEAGWIRDTRMHPWMLKLFPRKEHYGAVTVGQVLIARRATSLEEIQQIYLAIQDQFDPNTKPATTRQAAPPVPAFVPTLALQ